jgi:hypothetical protein
VAASEIRAIRVHVTRESILAVAVHGELDTPNCRERRI